jgi:hypothetical protein
MPEVPEPGIGPYLCRLQSIARPSPTATRVLGSGTAMCPKEHETSKVSSVTLTVWALEPGATANFFVIRLQFIRVASTRGDQVHAVRGVEPVLHSPSVYGQVLRIRKVSV